MERFCYFSTFGAGQGDRCYLLAVNYREEFTYPRRALLR